MGTRFNWGRAAGAGLSSVGRSLKANKQQQEAEAKLAADRAYAEALEQSRWGRNQQAQDQRASIAAQRQLDYRNEVNPFVGEDYAVNELGYSPSQWGAISQQVPTNPVGIGAQGPQSLTEPKARMSTAQSLAPTQGVEPEQINDYGFYPSGEPISEFISQAERIKFRKDEGVDPVFNQETGKYVFTPYISPEDTIGAGGPDDASIQRHAKFGNAFGEFKYGLSGARESITTGPLSEGSLQYAGADPELSSRMLPGLMLGLEPVYNNIADDLNADGTLKHSTQQASSMAMMELYGTNPGLFPATDFENFPDLSWDEFKNGKLVDEKFGKDKHFTIDDAKKKVAEILDGSENKTLTYISIMNGLKSIGMDNEEALSVVGQLQGFNPSEYKPESSGVDVSGYKDTFVKEVEALGPILDSRTIGGVKSLKASDGKWYDE